jgi:cell division protein FtsA
VIKSDYILAVDIGSTKICSVIAEKRSGDINVIGTGISKAQGFKKGAITSIETSSRSIKASIEDAKRVAGTSVDSATISLSAIHTKTTNSKGLVNIPSGSIGIEEIKRVMDSALYNANIPSDYEVIHAIPYNFTVDDNSFVDDPLGMNGNRLEASVHIVMARKSTINDLTQILKRVGLDVDNFVLDGYASSLSVLELEDKELGVALIDLGGSSANLIVYEGNNITFNDTVNIGSAHITNDLYMILRTPLQVAEALKLQYGTLQTIGDRELSVKIPITNSTATENVHLTYIQKIIDARVAEIFKLLQKKLDDANIKQTKLKAGLVLTGGLTNLKGIKEYAIKEFQNRSIKIGVPRKENAFLEFKDPAMSTVIGLVLYAFEESREYEIDSKGKLRYKSENIELNSENSNNNKQTQNLQIELNNYENSINDTKLDVDIEKERSSVPEPKNEGFIQKILTKIENIF